MWVQKVITEMHFGCLKIISSCAGHLFKWDPVSPVPKILRKGNGWGCEWIHSSARPLCEPNLSRALVLACVAREKETNHLQKGVHWDWKAWGSQTAHKDLSLGSDRWMERGKIRGTGGQQPGALIFPNAGSQTHREETISLRGGRPGAGEPRKALQAAHGKLLWDVEF